MASRLTRTYGLQEEDARQLLDLVQLSHTRPEEELYDLDLMLQTAGMPMWGLWGRQRVKAFDRLAKALPGDAGFYHTADDPSRVPIRELLERDRKPGAQIFLELTRIGLKEALMIVSDEHKEFATRYRRMFIEIEEAVRRSISVMQAAHARTKNGSKYVLQTAVAVAERRNPAAEQARKHSGMFGTNTQGLRNRYEKETGNRAPHIIRDGFDTRTNIAESLSEDIYALRPDLGGYRSGMVTVDICHRLGIETESKNGRRVITPKWGPVVSLQGAKARLKKGSEQMSIEILNGTSKLKELKGR